MHDIVNATRRGVQAHVDFVELLATRIVLQAASQKSVKFMLHCILAISTLQHTGC